MREHHQNLLLLGLAILVIAFGIVTWSNAHNLQGEAVKGYVLRNFEGKEITPKGELSIGVITPLSGPYKFIGQESVQGFQLAKDTLAAQGKTVHFIYKDSECDPVVAERRANELMASGVSYIIGADCYGKDPIVINGISFNLNPTREADNPSSFSLQSPLEEETGAFFAQIKHQPATLAIIFIDDAFGNDYLAAIKAKSPGRVIAAYSYSISQDAFAGIADKVKARDSEAVFIVAENVETLQKIVTALAAADYLNQAYANVPVTQAYLDSLGPGRYSFEGLTFVSDIDPISTRTTATSFVTSLGDAYGAEPTTYSANAYDSAILLSRMDDKYEDPARVSDAMHALLNHEGVTGLLTINGNSVTRSTYVRTVRDGKIVEG
jgi:ABC-type branched-subunit amino acid transport system substrate-binding protein